MEEIYPPESYGASECVPLTEYFEKFNVIFPPEPSTIDGNTSMREYLIALKNLLGESTSYDEVKELSKICSIDHLTCDAENTVNFPIKVPEHINSCTKLPSPFINTDENKLAVNRAVLGEQDPKDLGFGNKRNHQKKLSFILPPTEPDLQPGSEFIVSILIYRPVAFKFFTGKNSSERLRFHHEIVALGKNTLAELRDTIPCSSDFGLCKEVENTKIDLRSLSGARFIYPSGFIFINDVFYNDLREQEAIDYSLPIIEWAKEKKIHGLRSESMENVTIDSLRPRFGYPYVYMHQGDCEHIFVFADAKLLDSKDCLHSQCYPHVLKVNRNTNKMCLMCSVSFAKWICIGSDRLPQHKVFLCTDCCNSYNYVNGEKMGDFKLYPFYEKHVLQ